MDQFPAPPQAAATPRRWQPLGAIDRRVLGVLAEKAKTTPDVYPMSLNAVCTGCNQKNNRQPLMQLEPADVEESLDRLRELGAVGSVEGYGRVQKYRHYLYEWLGVDKVEIAVMTELLLRGDQTIGELRGRASRMEPIADLAALQPVLDSLEAKGLIVALTPEGRGQAVTHSLYQPREMESLRAKYRGAAPTAAAPTVNAPTPAALPPPAAEPVRAPVRPTVLPSRRVLAMMAHPDDAEILCAGTLVRLAQAGWEIHIATATAGDCGTVAETPEAIGARRREEARRAASLIQATYHCLDQRDGLVVYDRPTLQAFYDLFRRVAPSLVFTHSAEDYMMDHVVVSQLARAASFLYSAPNISALPVAEGSGVPYLYYCDPLEGIDPRGRPVEPTTLVDIGAQLELKSKMLACHESQRAWLLAHHGIDEYLDAMRRHAAARGRLAGTSAAEAFVQHRGHAYPRNDLLKELFQPGDRR